MKSVARVCACSLLLVVSASASVGRAEPRASARRVGEHLLTPTPSMPWPLATSHLAFSTALERRSLRVGAAADEAHTLFAPDVRLRGQLALLPWLALGVGLSGALDVGGDGRSAIDFGAAAELRYGGWLLISRRLRKLVISFSLALSRASGARLAPSLSLMQQVVEQESASPFFRTTITRLRVGHALAWSPTPLLACLASLRVKSDWAHASSGESIEQHLDLNLMLSVDLAHAIRWPVGVVAGYRVRHQPEASARQQLLAALSYTGREALGLSLTGAWDWGATSIGTEISSLWVRLAAQYFF